MSFPIEESARRCPLHQSASPSQGAAASSSIRLRQWPGSRPASSIASLHRERSVMALEAGGAIAEALRSGGYRLVRAARLDEPRDFLQLMGDEKMRPALERYLKTAFFAAAQKGRLLIVQAILDAEHSRTIPDAWIFVTLAVILDQGRGDMAQALLNSPRIESIEDRELRQFVRLVQEMPINHVVYEIQHKDLPPTTPLKQTFQKLLDGCFSRGADVEIDTEMLNMYAADGAYVCASLELGSGGERDSRLSS